MSKADTKDWHIAQNDAQLEKLYHYSEQRHEGPDPETLSELGHDDVAQLVVEAYNKLLEAYYLLRSRGRNELSHRQPSTERKMTHSCDFSCNHDPIPDNSLLQAAVAAAEFYALCRAQESAWAARGNSHNISPEVVQQYSSASARLRMLKALQALEQA